MTATVLPFVKAADLPVARPFPLAARIENTRAVMYFTTDAERTEKALQLVTMAWPPYLSRRSRSNPSILQRKLPVGTIL